MTGMTQRGTGYERFGLPEAERRGDYDKDDVAAAAGWVEQRGRSPVDWRVMNGAVVANTAAATVRGELGLPAVSRAVEWARRRVAYGSCRRCGGPLDVRMRTVRGVRRETRFCPAACGKTETRKDRDGRGVAGS